MCCLFATSALFGPRIALIIWWLLDMSFFDDVFATVFWPIVGVVFAPWTTLFYVIGFVGSPGTQGWDYVWIVIGILLDLASYSSGALQGRRGTPVYGR